LHVGGIATWHVDDVLALYTGIDCGSQTSFGSNDNNSLPAGYFGFGLDGLLDGKLDVLAMSRLGPEESLLVDPNANSLMTSWNDVTVIYKRDDKLTIAGEANFYYDGGLNNTAYGLAAYLTYAYSDRVSFNARAEAMRDNSGKIVGNYIGADSYTNSIRGLPFGFIAGADDLRRNHVQCEFQAIRRLGADRPADQDARVSPRNSLRSVAQWNLSFQCGARSGRLYVRRRRHLWLLGRRGRNALRRL
jgi:hypothetical protein